jgi:hypothetical protein
MELSEIKRNEENIKWWRGKSFYFNLIIILLLFFVLLFEKIIFPFTNIGFIIPILIIFIISLNVIYFIIYAILSLLSKKRILHFKQIKRIYIFILSISIALIVYYTYVDFKDMHRINQRNKELDLDP